MPQAVYRIEVRPKPGIPDPRGASALRDVQSLGLERAPERIDSASVYLLEGELDENQVAQLADELLADPVTEQATIGASRPKASALIEVHPLPGVMDPDAEAVKQAINAMLGIDVDVRTGRRYDMHGVDRATARAIAERTLANSVIHAIHDEPYFPQQFPHGTLYDLRIITVKLRDLDDAALMKLSREAHLFLSLEEMKAIQAEYRRLGRDPHEIELETIAQTWSEHCVHKTFKATIRYREDISDASQSPRIAMRGLSRPNHEVNPDGSITIHNLLKSTVAAATHELIADGVDWCLSVFVDNSGVIAFDDQHAVCFKVETHNHPSAIEPYGGAATGIGGCIRDVMGTGLAAKPIAATDVFCVAYPDRWGLNTENTEDTERSEVRGQRSEVGDQRPAPSIQNPQSTIQHSASELNPLPQGVLHPRRILTQVVAGVRDYGNRMGIPTLNGAVWFDDNYIGNPLVFCGVVGVMPRDKIKGQPQAGDRIVVVGGRTGRDGIHGATFSSAELTDTHADEFAHAVQIGNAITEKITLDAILAARDYNKSDRARWDDAPRRLIDGNEQSESAAHDAERRATMSGRATMSDRDAPGCLFNAITDCGAGGFSSAVGEMGRELGAVVHLDKAPLKYTGLSPTEIWISESQERMILAVPPENLEALREICAQHNVEMADLGHFGEDSGELILKYRDTEVGRISTEFLHNGLPETVREATWKEMSTSRKVDKSKEKQPRLDDALSALLSHPNIASKRWIIRQYDHEVQGRTVIKPIASDAAQREGPMDAAVITPVLGSSRGLAIGNGLATGWQRDPYLMALAAIDECVRNLVCVGADPSRIAILDNFCWPSCNHFRGPENLGALVRAAEGCYVGAKAYRTPFISGKDSLNNQFTTEDGRTIQIPYTLLISGMGIVHDVHRCVTMDAKAAGNLLLIVGQTDYRMGGSHFELIHGELFCEQLPIVDLQTGPRTARAVAEIIRDGLIRSAHDCSEGGLLVAAAEMAFAGGLGLRMDLTLLPVQGTLSPLQMCFAETPSRYLIEIERHRLNEVDAGLRRHNIRYGVIGEFNDSHRLTLGGELDVHIDELHETWAGALNW